MKFLLSLIFCIGLFASASAQSETTVFKKDSVVYVRTVTTETVPATQEQVEQVLAQLREQAVKTESQYKNVLAQILEMEKVLVLVKRENSN
jgi:uncharacterized protein YfcZ (UPF0381/DUF406 family)